MFAENTTLLSSHHSCVKCLVYLLCHSILPFAFNNSAILPSAGHSHQLFHVCGIMATHFQMRAIEQDMVIRRQWLLTHSLPISFSNTLGVALLCVVLNLAIIILYSLPLFWSSASPDKKHSIATKTATTRPVPATESRLMSPCTQLWTSNDNKTWNLTRKKGHYGVGMSNDQRKK